MSRILPRFRRAQQEAEDAAKLRRILIDTGEAAPPPTVTKATLPGDTRRLRGIPVAGGACGTSPGTDPLAHVLRSDRAGRHNDSAPDLDMGAVRR